MDNPSNEQSDEIPEFFLEKKEKPEKKKISRKLFGLKKRSDKTSLVKKDEGSLVDVDFNRNKLFSKGINLMADEKLEDASHVFEMVLRINPNDVDALLKLGYSRFHLEDYSESMRAYDKVLDIDVTNADAWNLKSLVFYERKVYGKALDCADKAIDSDPTFGMAWYNRSCYLSLLNQIPESLDALVRSIEIDVKNAKRAVKDKDFMNVRLEEGFKRIVEVVVIESLRQGYHTIGSIVWTTFLDKEDVLKCLARLMKRGLVVKHEKRQVWSTIDTYDLVPEIANKIGTVKRGMLGIPSKSLPKPVKNLKTKKVEITSQNHGFKVEENSIPSNVNITHLSLFDKSVEGIELKNKPIFSVQYHPEASPGPQDSKYLFNKFINYISKEKKYAKKKRS